jgi:anthranilate phosphoribosyltransferase
MSEALLRDALRTVVAGGDLNSDTSRRVMDMVMEGAATPAQIGALLTALRAKGETVDELTGMVESMRDHATRVTLDADAVDTCGTGGDGAGTFNISTLAALVVAGAGCAVAKHGNRAASSRCGSADVLEALGVAITLSADGVSRCVREAGIGFMFAPAFHPAMRHVAGVRRELGFRTVFNVLGPLANPARVRHQAIGVADASLALRMAQVLQRIGHRRALVFSGPNGIDELGVEGVADGYEARPEEVRLFCVDPGALGIEPVTVASVRGGDAAANAVTIRAVLDGEPGPARDVGLLNAAAALLAAEKCKDLSEGIDRARVSIDSGAARRSLETLIAVSNEAAG